jgi:NADH:ubiquinone oxidoreductase subunit 6 (subunit J)
VLYVVLISGLVICAIFAVRAKQMLTSVLWLIGTSAVLSVLFYIMGACHLAVIELSVGAGLIAVLFVFAISVASDKPITLPSLIPRPLAWIFVILAVAFTAWRVLPIGGTVAPTTGCVESTVLWQERSLDTLVQVALIFAGVVGMLGLLSGSRKRPPIGLEAESDEL